jgi:hypothetical protein
MTEGLEAAKGILDEATARAGSSADAARSPPTPHPTPGTALCATFRVHTIRESGELLRLKPLVGFEP